MIDLTGTGIIPEYPTAVAMGLFDGLHMGHRSVINKAAGFAEASSKNGGRIMSAVFTFDTGNFTPKYNGEADMIVTGEVKRGLIDELGVDYIYSPDFSDIKDLSAAEFANRVLFGRLRARYVVCGEDFRFGRGAKADINVLDRICGENNAELHVVPQVTDKTGRRISSTIIRGMIRNGDIAEANELLGSRYQIKMPVVSGKKLGRTIDFPTVNQYFPERQVIPKYGVYESEAEYGGIVFKGITNIGIKPTVQSSGVPLCETYIIGFDGQLYGEMLKLSLIRFIRPERKFNNLSELKVQIKEDLRLVTCN